MPFIRIDNYHPSYKYNCLAGLPQDLRQACVQADTPDVGTVSQVTAVFGAEQAVPDDKNLWIFVTGIFDRAGRSTVAKDGLATALALAAKKRLPSDWCVRVFIERYNWELDSFAAGADESA
ncbi:MAG: hypothetical protein PHS79_04315 [Patescibacteria group bacterium]|nr:hypothetical protein [Patescibacteria group bacterium]